MEKVKTFSQMVDFIKGSDIGIELLVPMADSSSALEGAASFLELVPLGVNVLLIGDGEKVEAAAHKKGHDSALRNERVKLVQVETMEGALKKTVERIDKNKNQIVLKGNLTTDQLMKGLLQHKEKVIQKGNIITHMRVFESPFGICQICDGGINVVSNIKDEEKREKMLAKIQENGEEIMRIFGYPDPEMFDAGNAGSLDDLNTVFRQEYTDQGRFPALMLFPWIGPANIIYKAIAGTPWDLAYERELFSSGAGRTVLFTCRGCGGADADERPAEGRSLLIAMPEKDADYEDKKKLVELVIGDAKSAGVEQPKIALLDFTEQYAAFPDTPSIRESRRLVEQFEDRGDCIIEGPMAFDLAASKEAAKTKKYESRVAGEPDVLFAPDFTAGGVLTEIYRNWKQLQMPWPGGDISIGGAVPILIPSRSDSSKHKLRSVIAAAYVTMRQDEV